LEKGVRYRCWTPFVILDSMGRPARSAQGGLVYHTLNRANARLAILHDDGDFAAFERILAEAVTRFDIRLLAYCLMPNHFHFLLWPRGDGDLSQFMQWLRLEKGSGTVAGTARRVLRTTVPDPFSSRSQPYGPAPWQKRTASRLGLESTLRPHGRPPKKCINGT
jgi:Transposase IS200 like